MKSYKYSEKLSQLVWISSAEYECKTWCCRCGVTVGVIDSAVTVDKVADDVAAGFVDLFQPLAFLCLTWCRGDTFHTFYTPTSRLLLALPALKSIGNTIFIGHLSNGVSNWETYQYHEKLYGLESIVGYLFWKSSPLLTLSAAKSKSLLFPNSYSSEFLVFISTISRWTI